MSEQQQEPERSGFEYQGTFYRWHVSDTGKDLMLIDRFAGLPVLDFFDLLDDEEERGRGPILLTLIATSIRFAHPGWSVPRIARMVENLSLSDVEFVGEDEEEAEPLPPQSQKPSEPPADEPSPSLPNGSSSSSPLRAVSASKRSSETRA